ncbi:MAG: ATP-binding protein [Oscillospiraceae bacterium]|nr:ATP-binding protein [Oscillospiraceae bacterium]
MTILKRARILLADEQEKYKARRAADTERIKEKLPMTATLLSEIRRVFLNAMEDVLSHVDEEAFEKAKAQSLSLQEELRTLLSANGFEPDAMIDTHMCKICADTGYTNTKPCVCLRRHLAAVQTAELSALGGRTFDSFNLNVFSSDKDPNWGLSQRENMEGNYFYCKSWVKNFGEDSPNLFLNGGTGQGKTFLCGCIAHGVAEMGAEIKYTTAIALFKDLEDKRFDRAETDTDDYYNSELLIIDDLGTEMTTAFVQSALYDIINTRLVAGRKMIINANFSAGELSQVYMPQICSRLLGEFKQLHFFGPDVRMK